MTVIFQILPYILQCDYCNQGHPNKFSTNLLVAFVCRKINVIKNVFIMQCVACFDCLLVANLLLIPLIFIYFVNLHRILPGGLRWSSHTVNLKLRKNYLTVPLKSKLTVPWASRLDTRSSKVSSIESRVSRFEYRVEKNNDLVAWLISREINWTNRPHSRMLYSKPSTDMRGCWVSLTIPRFPDEKKSLQHLYSLRTF